MKHERFLLRADTQDEFLKWWPELRALFDHANVLELRIVCEKDGARGTRGTFEFKSEEADDCKSKADRDTEICSFCNEKRGWPHVCNSARVLCRQANETRHLYTSAKISYFSMRSQALKTYENI